MWLQATAQEVQFLLYHCPPQGNTAQEWMTVQTQSSAYIQVLRSSQEMEEHSIPPGDQQGRGQWLPQIERRGEADKCVPGQLGGEGAGPCV